MTVAENIKRIRKEKGLTQEELGKLCGMADSAIRRYESGRANPKLETKQKIAVALDCQVSDIDESLSINRKMPYFANGLQTLRVERNLTQKELAKELNVNKKNISNWEAGTHMPFFDIVERIVKYFDTSLLYLLYGEAKYKKSLAVVDANAIAREKAIRSAPKFTSCGNGSIDYPISKTPVLPNPPKFTCASRSHAQTEAYDLFHSLLSEDWIMTQEQETIAVQLRDILSIYSELNDTGRKTAVKRIEELRYTDVMTDSPLDDMYFNRIKKKINNGEKLSQNEIEWWHNYLDTSVKTVGAIFESLFSMLNNEGRRKAHTQINRAIDQIELLTKIPEYQKEPPDPPEE